MDQILQQIGQAVGDILGSPIVRVTTQVVAIYVVIIWLAAAYWAFRDMQLRTENPVLPYLAAAFIIVFSPLAFIAAVIVYRIVRPQEKIGEVYERNLAEEALLAEVEAVASCPTCARRVNDEWIICPTCRTRLKRVCPNCSRLVGLDWSLCAWCGKDFERRDVAAATSREPVAVPRPAVADVAGLAPGPMAGPIAAPMATPMGPMATPSPPQRPTRTRPARTHRSASGPLPER